ncbi:MAG: hypothetical protein SVS85_01930, partial [Candidatus Nanohaloarchaea archaeon]|nr:hypothetical protein [Candidatus Nanohaloarchaea archaeon]
MYGEDPEFTLITDTVDGSRLLGAGLSGAYSMAAVTPVTESPTLEDVEIAVQTELPAPRHTTGEQFLWRKDEGLNSRRFPGSEEFSQVKSGSRSSRDTELMSYVPPFQGPSPVADQVQAAVEPQLEPELTPDLRNSSGGQLANVALGLYGFVVDARPLEGEIREKPVVRTAKPYDVCTYRAFASQEARFYSILPYKGSYKLQEGIPAPLDIETPVGWIGYASK